MGVQSASALPDLWPQCDSIRELRLHTGEEPCRQTLGLGETKFHDITTQVCVCVCVCVCAHTLKLEQSNLEPTLRGCVWIRSHLPEGFWDIWPNQQEFQEEHPGSWGRLCGDQSLSERVHIHLCQGGLHERLSQEAW